MLLLTSPKMADTQSIEESLQALHASYQEFTEKLDGDARLVTELFWFFEGPQNPSAN